MPPRESHPGFRCAQPGYETKVETALQTPLTLLCNDLPLQRLATRKGTSSNEQWKECSEVQSLDGGCNDPINGESGHVAAEL